MKRVILLLLIISLLLAISFPVFAEDVQPVQPTQPVQQNLEQNVTIQTADLLNYYKSITDHAINAVLLIVSAAAVLLTILSLIGSIAVPLISANKISKIEKDAKIAMDAAQDAKNNALQTIRDLESRIIEIGQSADEAKDFSRIARSETIASEGLVWYLTKEYDRALKSYNEAIELNSEEPRFYFNKGNIYYEQGYYEKAITEFSRSIQLNPNNNEKAHYNRGRAYCALAQYEKAIADYTLSIAQNQNNDKAYYNRARTYERIGKHEEAKQDFQQYHSLIKEKNIETQNNPLLCQW